MKIEIIKIKEAQPSILRNEAIYAFLTSFFDGWQFSLDLFY